MKKTLFALTLAFLALGLSADENSASGAAGGSSQGERRAEKSDIAITVTASRSEKPGTEVPASVTVITAEQLGKRTVPEALSLFAGMDVRSFNGSSASLQPSARGFTDNGQGRVLILFDGIKLNNPDMAGFNWQAIPGGKIERIEVLHGGASSLYGDYAVGAVINIIPEKPGEGISFDYSLGAGSSSLLKNSFTASAGGEKYSISVSASDTASEGWRERSGTESTSFNTTVKGEFTEKLDGSFFFSYGREMYEMPGSLTKEQFEKEPEKASNLQDCSSSDNIFLQAKGGWEVSDLLGFSVSSGYRMRNVKSDMVSWFSHTDTSLDSFSLNSSVLFSFPSVLGGMSVTGGADVVLDRLDVKQYSDEARSTKTSDGGAGKKSFGFFSRGELYLLENLLVTLTGRVDSAVYSFDPEAEDDKKVHTPLSWGSGINWIFPGMGKVYLRYERVFRYPFLDEQINYQGFGTAGIVSGLEPEKGHSFDAGFEVSGYDFAGAKVNFFLVMMDDEIAYNMASGKNENLSETLRYGVESSVILTPLNFFSLAGSYNFTAAEYSGGSYDGKKLPLAPEHRFSLVPEFSFSKGVKTYAELAYSGSYYGYGDNDNSLGKIDGVFLVNAGAELSAETGAGDVSFYGKVKNIADTMYAALVYYGGYYPGNGREVEFGLSYSF